MQYVRSISSSERLFVFLPLFAFEHVYDPFCVGEADFLCPRPFIGIAWPAGIVRKDVASKISGQSIPATPTICSIAPNVLTHHVAYVFAVYAYHLHMNPPTRTHAQQLACQPPLAPAPALWPDSHVWMQCAGSIALGLGACSCCATFCCMLSSLSCTFGGMYDWCQKREYNSERIRLGGWVDN